MYAKLAWDKYTEDDLKLVMDFNEGYKDYITKGKTERKCHTDVEINLIGYQRERSSDKFGVWD